MPTQIQDAQCSTNAFFKEARGLGFEIKTDGVCDTMHFYETVRQTGALYFIGSHFCHIPSTTYPSTVAVSHNYALGTVISSMKDSDRLHKIIPHQNHCSKSLFTLNYDPKTIILAKR